MQEMTEEYRRISISIHAGGSLRQEKVFQDEEGKGEENVSVDDDGTEVSGENNVQEDDTARLVGGQNIGRHRQRVGSSKCYDSVSDTTPTTAFERSQENNRVDSSPAQGFTIIDHD